MDRLDRIKTYITVVETGSFSAASRLIGIPLSTVSRKIAELENYLGAQLLRRTTRKLELTETGSLYLEQSKTILDRLEEAERLVRREYHAPKGNLHITASTMFGRTYLVPLVAEFLKTYPDINVRLTLVNHNVNLIEEHLDFAFRIGTLADSTLVATHIGSTRSITCASASYIATHGEPQKLQDLTQHSCVTFEGLSMQSATIWQFQKGRKILAQPVHPRLIVSTVDAAIEACIGGFGIARMLEYPVIDYLKSGTLKIILTSYEPPPKPIHLLYHKPNVLPIKMRAFIDFMVPKLKKIFAA